MRQILRYYEVVLDLLGAAVSFFPQDAAFLRPECPATDGSFVTRQGMTLLCMTRPVSDVTVETQSDWGYSLGVADWKGPSGHIGGAYPLLLLLLVPSLVVITVVMCICCFVERVLLHAGLDLQHSCKVVFHQSMSLRASHAAASDFLRAHAGKDPNHLMT